MKQFKTLIVAIALILGISASVNAQNSKVAHIDTQALLEDLPKYQRAQADLEKLRASYDADIKAQGVELQKKNEQYAREAQTKTNEENAARQREVAALQQNILDFRRNAYQDIAKKEGDLYRPILEEVRVKIQEVARAKGFQYVLDSTTGTGVLLADGYDLTADVKKALGL